MIKDSLTNSNKSLCAYPWSHLEFRENGNVHLCCQSIDKDPIANLSSSFDLHSEFHNQKMKDIRKKMLLGEKIKDCESCYEREKSGFLSDRILSFHRPELQNINLDKVTPQLSSIGLRASNICNLTCRMCNSEFSTKWYKDQDLLLSPTDLKTTLQLKDKVENPFSLIFDQVNTIEFIHFAGGEPLASKDHLHLLEQMIDQGLTSVKLSYDTNLTTVPKDLWKKFKQVSLSVSIDGIEDRLEYIRQGAQWDMILQNLDLIEQMENIKFSLHCTVQALNVLHIPEMLLFFIQEKSMPVQQIRFNLLETPVALNARIFHPYLPIIKQKYQGFMKTKFFSLLNEEDFNYVSSSLNSILRFIQAKDDSHLVRDFLRFHQALDERWGTSLFQTFPELDLLRSRPS